MLRRMPGRHELAASSSALGVVDWFGLILGLLVALFLLAFPFTVAPAFLGMFADFGGELPLFTRIALSPWFGLSLGIVVGALLAVAALLRGRSVVLRRGLVVVAVVIGLAGFALCIAGAYLPIFNIAGAIRG
jgi:hypothetical protein